MHPSIAAAIVNEINRDRLDTVSRHRPVRRRRVITARRARRAA